MGTITDTLQCLEQLKVRTIARRVFEKNSKAMVLMNMGQLFIGKNSKGENLRPYAPWKMEDGTEYADFKEELNPRPGWGNPDLKLTGSFYKGMFAKLEGDNIIQDSTDKKSEWLKKHYDGDDSELPLDGESNIFGLTDENHVHFVQEVYYPDFKKEIQAVTGLNLK